MSGKGDNALMMMRLDGSGKRVIFTHAKHGEVVKDIRVSDAFLALGPSIDEFKAEWARMIRKIALEVSRDFDHMESADVR